MLRRFSSLTSFAVLLAIGAAAVADPATAPTTNDMPLPIHPTIKAPEGVPQTITSPLGNLLSLKFDDEFNAVTDKDGQPYFDRRKWIPTFWQGSSARTLISNGEAQYYTDKDYAGKGNIPKDQRPNPFSFEAPGILTISATKVPEANWNNYWMGTQRCFSSGILVSDHHFTFQYGYVEGRFRLPAARGAWPAFWLLGNDPSLGDEEHAHLWPPEIDIFEFFGHSPKRHHNGVIARKGEKLPYWGGYVDDGVDLSRDFHTWGLAWTQKDLVWTFDGRVVSRTTPSESFNRPMYILINLAVGGNWYSQDMTAAGTPYKPWEVDETTMPWKMECDYVRIYQ